MTATDTKRKLAEKRAELAATPDRGFDSARRRAEIRDEIDGLLDEVLAAEDIAPPSDTHHAEGTR